MRSAMGNDITKNLNPSPEEILSSMFTMIQRIDSRLVDLEAKVDSRLHDTRPNFEATHAQLTEVIDSQQKIREEINGELQGVRNNLSSLREDLSGEIQGVRNDLSSLREEIGNEIQGVRNDLSSGRDEVSGEIQGVRNDLTSLRAETEKGFRTIDRRMERQIGEFERLHAYQRDLEDRVDKIEKQLSS
jgi:DNA repair exonuclease SbcCD ATPase subunit